MERKLVVMAVDCPAKRNIGTFLRTATAFGCQLIIVVGCPMFSTHGSHGAQKRVRIQHVAKWEDFYGIATNNNWFVLGITPTPLLGQSYAATSLDSTLPPSAKVAVVLTELTVEGCEGIFDGCHHVVHADFYNSDLQVLVPYTNKIGMCLHKITSHHDEGAMTGEKFTVGSTVHKDFKVNFKRNSLNHVV